MTYSSLICKEIRAHSNNYGTRGGASVNTFTPHHMAGNLSVETCGALFQRPTRYASANYLIGTDGRIAGNVPEEYRAYTSSSYANDRRAVTVEVANASGAPTWTISQAAWNSLVNLAVDVCRRRGFRLDYDGTASGSLTEHRMFSATSCPGPWLHGQLKALEKQVNAILDGSQSAPSVPEGGGVVVSDYSDALGYHAWFGPKCARMLQQQLGTVQDGVISGQPTSNKGYFWAVSGGVQYGSSGSDAVLALQRKLKAAGYDPNGLDRWYGRGCITAHQRLLRDKGYYKGSVDGFHGHETNSAMCRALLDGLYSKSW